MSRRAAMAGLGSLALSATSAFARDVDRDTGSSNWGDLELLDAQDRSFRLDDAGKPFTLVKLWANWCSICMSELDVLPTIAPALGPDTVDVILVSHPQDWARDLRIARERNVAVRSARPSANNSRSVIQQDLMAENGWYYVPRSVLFSRARGQVVWSHVGRLDWADPAVLARIRKLVRV